MEVVHNSNAYMAPNVVRHRLWRDFARDHPIGVEDKEVEAIEAVEASIVHILCAPCMNGNLVVVVPKICCVSNFYSVRQTDRFFC